MYQLYLFWYFIDSSSTLSPFFLVVTLIFTLKLLCVVTETKKVILLTLWVLINLSGTFLPVY